MKKKNGKRKAREIREKEVEKGEEEVRGNDVWIQNKTEETYKKN